MKNSRAVITLHSGKQLSFDCDAGGLDELTRFVDAWQAGRKGGADINCRDPHGNPITVPVEYRDVLRVDFPKDGS